MLLLILPGVCAGVEVGVEEEEREDDADGAVLAELAGVVEEPSAEAEVEAAVDEDEEAAEEED